MSENAQARNVSTAETLLLSKTGTTAAKIANENWINWKALALDSAECEEIGNLFMSLAPMTKVTILDLSGSMLARGLESHNGAATLAAALHTNALPKLERINIGGNRIGDKGMCAIVKGLVASEASATLSTLTIGGNELSDKTAACLAQDADKLPVLERLDLSENMIGEAGAQELFLSHLLTAPA